MLNRTNPALWKAIPTIFVLCLFGFLARPVYAGNAPPAYKLVQCDSNGVTMDNTAVSRVYLPIKGDAAGKFFLENVDVAVFTGSGFPTRLAEQDGFAGSRLEVDLGAVTNYDYSLTNPIIYEIKFRGHYGSVGENNATNIIEDWQDSGLFFKAAPPDIVNDPVVTGITPVSGPASGGTAVTITGSSFTGATGVSFGSAAAESFTVNSDTSITAVSPAGSGKVEVNVIKPNGTSSPAVQFTYLSASAGSISGTISEGANPIAGAQVTLTVSGQPYSATTDSNGDYTILNIPAGTGYTVTAGKSGYDNGSAGNIQVTAGETTSSVNISLSASGPGNALAFDGTDDYVTMGDNDGSISALTIETWVKWDPASAGDIQFICGKGLEQMEIHTGAGGANGLRFIPAPGVYLDAANALPTGIWTHLAFVYDPANSLAKMYINGSETALTNNGSNPLSTPIGNTNTTFHLGNRSNGSYYFKGLLDDFRIWNRVRSQQEILDDMTGALDVSVQTGLLSYYTFNQGTAGSDNSGLTNLPDLTGNYRGTLHNFALSGSTSNWLASDAWAGYEKTYTISYDSNGGTGTVPTDDLNYVAGAQATVKGQGQLEKNGSAFAGWNTSADGSGTSYAAGAEFTVTGNTTLYARWLSGGGKYTVTPADDAAYTVGTTAAGFAAMTVKSGVTGLKAFTVNIGVTASHTGKETAVFIQFRSGVQIALGTVNADFDQQAEAVVSFNVQTGDVVKVYIVDALTNAEDANPTLLQ